MPPFPETTFCQQRSVDHPNPLPTSAKPETNHNSQRSLSENLSIAPITALTLPAYRRLITLLLPIRYPDKFYKDSIADPTPSSLALCALWHDTTRPGKRKLDSLNDAVTGEPNPEVIGGIQCRLEPLPCPPTTTSPSTSTAQPTPHHQRPYNLYIQTLAILSPYRFLGVATALLDAIICSALTHYAQQGINVKEIYAHVWEANEEALEWYVKRGFEVGEQVVEGYYRKLRPSGARVVKRRVGVGDWVWIAGGWEGGEIARGGGKEEEGGRAVMDREDEGDG